MKIITFRFSNMKRNYKHILEITKDVRYAKVELIKIRKLVYSDEMYSMSCIYYPPHLPYPLDYYYDEYYEYKVTLFDYPKARPLADRKIIELGINNETYTDPIYFSKVIKERDRYYYRIDDKTIEIGKWEYERVIGNPFTYYFSTALKLECSINYWEKKTHTLEETLSHRGYRYMEMRRYKDALKEYNALLKICPENQEALLNRGKALYELGRYKKALKDLGSFLERKPNDGNALGEALVLRGDTFRNLGNYEEALNDYDLSLKLDLHERRALVGRGDTLCALGRYEEALHDYKRMLKLEPNNKEIIKKRREIILRQLDLHPENNSTGN